VLEHQSRGTNTTIPCNLQQNGRADCFSIYDDGTTTGKGRLKQPTQSCLVRE
jgi:hypothetical protein